MMTHGMTSRPLRRIAAPEDNKIVGGVDAWMRGWVVCRWPVDRPTDRRRLARSVLSSLLGLLTSGGGDVEVALDERAEFLGHAFVDVALKVDDLLGDAVERHPAPLGELAVLLPPRRQVDRIFERFALRPQRLCVHLQQKPLLPLPQVRLGLDAGGKVVAEPVGHFRDEAHASRPDARLFLQLPQRGFSRLLPGVNAPLRHLPRPLGVVHPPRRKHQTCRLIHHTKPHVPPIL
mmetsp:Transcript_5700/g.12132  ORF Transcript_5700/g.12132 Transcript_5700/m.12132 type:complete len:233 (+) Transcript_5700:150-848(+)